MRFSINSALSLFLLASTLPAQAPIMGALWRWPQDQTSTLDVALGDLDGDGDLDAFLAQGAMCDYGGCYPSLNRIYLNDGTGTFSWPTNALPNQGTSSSDVALGDVDGDGDLDAFVGGSPAYSPIRIHLNDGQAHFSDGSNLLITANPDFGGVELVDVDGDGDLDAFLTDPGEERLFLNDGSGRFLQAPQNLPAHVSDVTAIAFGDVDGDGDADVLLGQNGANRCYLNDGTGFFTEVNALPPHAQETRAIVLGDYDGDGDLDAFLANTENPQYLDRLYLNTGSGVFLDATAQLPGVANYTLSAACGDLDGDGDLDLLLGNHEEVNRLYLNDGSANFSDASALIPLETTQTNAVAIGDLDGDGDLDAFIANGGAYGIRFSRHNMIYTGLERQTAASTLSPRIGAPLDFEFWGPALGSWSLFLSSGTSAIPLPPLGTLWLDPTALFPAGSGALDAQRHGATSIPIPNEPLLVQSALHWQAVLSSPLRLGNREQTVFTP